MKSIKYIASFIGVVALIIVSGIYSYTPREAVASVSQGSSYKSATFAPVNVNASFLQSTILDSNTGTLGSVIITGAGAGYITLYDATTSNALIRTLTATTSLRVLAQFPASAAANTYTFDEDFYNGLVIEFTGTVATSTITYR